MHRRLAAVEEAQAPDARFAKALQAMRAGRFAHAIVELQSAVAADPGAAIAHLYLGDAYAGARSPAAAEAAYRTALKLWPDYPEAHVALGRLLLREGRIDPAIRALETGIRLQPGNAAGVLALALFHEQRSSFEEAATAWRGLLARAPGNLDALKGLARALLALGELSEALALAQRAAAAAPGDADAQFVLGNVLLRLQEPRASLAAYRRVTELLRTPKARFAEAGPLLMLGELAAGWAAYEARLGMRGMPWKVAKVRERLWDGGRIGAKRLLVHTEQGVGDTFQFIRYLPLLRERAGPEAHISLLCEPALAAVLATVGGYDTLHAPEKLGGIGYDYQLPLMSLPHRFGTTLETIPAAVPYLRLPPGTTTRIDRLPDAKLAVALAWAGRPIHSDDRMRSCPIEHLAPLFGVSAVQFFSIQVGARAAEIGPYLALRNVTSLSAMLTDYAQTLGVIDQVDLVIAVDTSVAHLAGAYGKPVWTLLAHGGEWRWLLERNDTPWYPSMRLFRQRVSGDWPGVCEEVRGELERLRDRVLPR